MKKIRYFLFMLRFIPVSIGVDWNDSKMTEDLNRWKRLTHINNNSRFSILAILLGSTKEFRNLFIYRNRKRPVFKRWVAIVYRPMETLIIDAQEIGGGLFIQHGFATMISAKSLGRNCWVNQQVTIGYKNKTGSSPVIGDNVMITCGAKVLGDIHVGDNAVIGANAVVIRDVEAGAVMGGVPAKRLK